MANPYDQFDSRNPYDQFDVKASPTPVAALPKNKFQEAIRNKTVGYGLADVAAEAPVKALNAFNNLIDRASYNAGGVTTDLTGSPAAGTAVNTAMQAVPMVLGGEALRPFSAAVADPIAQWLMRSSLKPTLPMRQSGQAAQATRTMLEGGYNVTKGGVESIGNKIDQLSDQIKQAISNSGATISTKDVADYVPQAFERFKNGPQAVQAVEDLGKVQTGFIDHPNVNGAQQIPIQVAQDMKTGYQRSIGDKGYGELKSPSTEGEKQIARGLREKISEAVPPVAGLNAQEKDLLAARKMASRAVELDSNKNPIGLGALISQPWMWPLWMWDRSPMMKSMTANALYSPVTQSLPGYAGGALYDAMKQGALYQQQ